MGDSILSETDLTINGISVMDIIHPIGEVYFRHFNPTTNEWEADPNDLFPNQTWTDITLDFKDYPFVKVGDRTTSGGAGKLAGHNGTHNHICSDRTYDYEWARFAAGYEVKTGLNRVPDTVNVYTSYNGGKAKHYTADSSGSYTESDSMEPSHHCVRVYRRTA